MSTTVNNTLPMNWDSSISYYKGEMVSYGNNIIYKSLQNNNVNHRPGNNSTWWEPLDIYKKEKTVLPHGDYSGDESFWERDNIYVDSNGYVFVNNEVTGINVKGQSAATVTFEDLTPEQIERLRGPRGETGPQGTQGVQGPEGPMGQVVLTPEQTAALKGDPGESAYQIWIDAGHTGSEQDFLDWLRSAAFTLDTALLDDSRNAVENRAIAVAFHNYQTYLNAFVSEFAGRITALENRLKATYQNEEHDFIFGVTDNGKYGYRYTYQDQVIPFDNSEVDVLQTSQAFASNLITSMQHEQQIIDPTIETISNNVEPFRGVSLTRAISSQNDDNTNDVLYSTNMSVLSFDEFNQERTYLYNEGKQLPTSVPGYRLYQMTENSNNISSNGIESKEGLIFPSSLRNYGYKITFKVKPYYDGNTVSYEIGGCKETATLPNIANNDKYTYSTGTFDTETEISCLMQDGYKMYFNDISSPSPWELMTPSFYYGQWSGWHLLSDIDPNLDITQYDEIQLNSTSPPTTGAIIKVADITTSPSYFWTTSMDGCNAIRINPTSGEYELLTDRSGTYQFYGRNTFEGQRFKILQIWVD